jgi:hypothetical protein
MSSAISKTTLIAKYIESTVLFSRTYISDGVIHGASEVATGKSRQQLQQLGLRMVSEIATGLQRTYTTVAIIGFTELSKVATGSQGTHTEVATIKVYSAVRSCSWFTRYFSVETGGQSGVYIYCKL